MYTQTQASVFTMKWFYTMLPLSLLCLMFGIVVGDGVSDNAFVNIGGTVPDAGNETMHVGGSLRRRGFLTTITQEELDHCIASLEAVAVDGKVGREEFLPFLESFSGRSLSFEGFNDLPLSLILIFFAAACSAGATCDNDDPQLSTAHVGTSDGLLNVFCISVKDVTVEQLRYKFQYQLEFPGQQQRLQSMGVIDSQLEQATELVLLHKFGCASARRRALSDYPRALVEQLHKLDFSDSGAITGSNRHRMPKMTFAASSANRNAAQNVPCDFRVHANITHAMNIECLSSLQGENTSPVYCVLVWSNVLVTAASILEETTGEHLRAQVAENLREAFISNEVVQYLFE